MTEPGSLPTPTHVEAEIDRAIERIMGGDYELLDLDAEPEPTFFFPVFVSREGLEGWALGVAMVFCDAVEWWAKLLPERR